VPSGRTDILRRAKKTDDAIGGWIVQQCRVLQARRAGSILTYVTREASAARREIGHEAPPPVVFYEMFVFFIQTFFYNRLTKQCRQVILKDECVFMLKINK